MQPTVLWVIDDTTNSFWEQRCENYPTDHPGVDCRFIPARQVFRADGRPDAILLDVGTLGGIGAWDPTQPRDIAAYLLDRYPSAPLFMYSLLDGCADCVVDELPEEIRVRVTIEPYSEDRDATFDRMVAAALATPAEKPAASDNGQIRGCWSSVVPKCMGCKTAMVVCPREGHPNSHFWVLERNDGMTLYVCPNGCPEP